MRRNLLVLKKFFTFDKPKQVLMPRMVERACSE
jgi:hypothetical protein